MCFILHFKYSYAIDENAAIKVSRIGQQAINILKTPILIRLLRIIICKNVK